MEPESNRKRESTNTENGEILTNGISEDDKTEEINGEKSADSSGSLTNGTDEKVNSTRSLLESLDLEVPSSYEVQPGAYNYSNSSRAKNNTLFYFQSISQDLHGSIYLKILMLRLYQTKKKISLFFKLNYCQIVRMFDCVKVKLFSVDWNFSSNQFCLITDETVNPGGKKKKVIPVNSDIFNESRGDESSLDGSHTSLEDQDLDMYLDSPDELEDSIMESKYFFFYLILVSFLIYFFFFFF